VPQFSFLEVFPKLLPMDRLCFFPILLFVAGKINPFYMVMVFSFPCASFSSVIDWLEGLAPVSQFSLL